MSKSIACAVRSNQTSATESEFITRAVGKLYAVATSLPLTDRVKEQLKVQNAAMAKNTLVTIGNRLSTSLKKAKTPEDCRKVMRVIEGHISAQKALQDAGNANYLVQLRKWFEVARKKCERLVESSDLMEETQDEKDEDEETVKFASHVVVASAVFSCILASALVSETVAREMQRIPQHPDFAIARVVTVCPLPLVSKNALMSFYTV